MCDLILLPIQKILWNVLSRLLPANASHFIPSTSVLSPTAFYIMVEYSYCFLKIYIAYFPCK